MLTSAVIKGLSLAQSRSIELPYRDAPTGTSIFINKVDGLGPVKADITMTSYPDQDEDNYQSSRVGGRTIAFSLSLRPRWNIGETVQSLRRSLYRVVPPKTPVRITLNDDAMVQTYIDGYVESLEPSIFEKKTDMILTIRASSAYLTSTTVVKNQKYTLNKTNPVNYLGDGPTPIAIDMTFARPTGSFSLQLNGSTLLRVDSTFNTGDRVSINTTPRSKSLKRIRSGSTYSLLDSISSGSLDIFIDAATDSLRINTDVGAAGSTDVYLLSYAARYVGV